MDIKITQGTIISNIRSQKFNGIRCYGIVISAKCDIAQEKVDCIHILPAYSLTAWLETAVFQKALDPAIDAQIRDIGVWATENGQDLDDLIELGPEKVSINIEHSVKNSSKKHAQEVCALWKTYLRQKEGQVTSKEIADFLNGAGRSVRTTMLSDLLSDKMTNYSFLPEGAYVDGGSMRDGLVVDFKDIIPLAFSHMQAIANNDYDCMRISPDSRQLTELNKMFFLENSRDIVEVKHQVISPWIERLMQNFSFSFCRIGVNSISSDERKKLYKQTIIEDGQHLVWQTKID